MTYTGSHAAAANVPQGTADRTAWRYGTGWRTVLHLNVGGGGGGMAVGREVIPTLLKSEKRNMHHEITLIHARSWLKIDLHIIQVMSVEFV